MRKISKKKKMWKIFPHQIQQTITVADKKRFVDNEMLEICEHEEL